MKAIVWQGPGQLVVSQRAVPNVQPNQVLVRSVSVGLCGTDVHLYEGAFAPAIPPLILGHEVAGLVESVGEGETALKAGDRVVINPTVGCGNCRYCLAGRFQHCHSRKTIGLSGWDGGLAEFFVAPIQNAHLMPDTVSWLDGACMDNLANAVHALEQVPYAPDETVAIFGCGASGLCFIQLCKQRGASRIIAVDVRDERLQWAKRVGAGDVVNAQRENASESIRALTDGVGVDLAIEASGALAGPPACIRSAAAGGRVLIFGVYEGLVNGVDFQDQHRREITIYGSSGAPDTFARGVELVASGQVQLGFMATHQVRLDDVPSLLAAKLAPDESDPRLKSVVMVAEEMA